MKRKIGRFPRKKEKKNRPKKSKIYQGLSFIYVLGEYICFLHHILLNIEVANSDTTQNDFSNQHSVLHWLPNGTAQVIDQISQEIKYRFLSINHVTGNI